MIFLDNASTMRVCPRTISVMNEYLGQEYYNPSALYAPTIKINKKIYEVRQNISKRLNANADELFFTSCATESNAWALNSGFKNKSGNIVVGCGEHASVYENAISLKNKGYDVRFSPLLHDGTIDIEQFEKIVDTKTSLVSIIHCSNETGAINDLPRISAIVKSYNPQAVFHSDGVQAFGKIDNDCSTLGVDMYSISAHKIGGSKGVGALYVKRPIKLAPLFFGGGQESGRRSGTENTAGIIGFGVALEEYIKTNNKTVIIEFKRYMIDAFKSVGGIINSEFNSSPNILSLYFEGLKSEILQHMICDEGVLIGLGSACSSKSKKNRVLSEMGLTQKQIDGSIRISFGTENTFEEVEKATKIIVNAVIKLRGKIFG